MSSHYRPAPFSDFNGDAARNAAREADASGWDTGRSPSPRQAQTPPRDDYERPRSPYRRPDEGRGR